MPKTGRFTVEFTLSDGKVWLAEFSHQHARTTCPHILGKAPFMKTTHPLRECPTPVVEAVRYHVGEPGAEEDKVIEVQHVTTAKLRHKGSPLFLTGRAPCSLLDVYNWRKGIHYAMQRALEKAKYCRLEKATQCIHPTSAGCKHGVDCPSMGKIIVAEKKPIYDEIMAAFWREMGIKGTASVARAEHGMGASESPYTMPAANVHGLGWAGMD